MTCVCDFEKKGRMSIAVMELVWRKAPYKGNTLLALLALADWSDDEGVSWPSVPTLSKKSRQSERNCQTCLTQLKTDGLIFVELREGTSSRYRINIKKLDGGCKDFTPKKSTRGGCKTQHKTMSQTAPYTSIEHTSIEPSEEQADLELTSVDLPSSNTKKLLDDSFTAIWDVYPKRGGGKSYTRGVYEKAVHSTMNGDMRQQCLLIYNRAQEYVDVWEEDGTPKKFIPMLSTWLSQRRFDEAPESLKEKKKERAWD